MGPSSILITMPLCETASPVMSYHRPVIIIISIVIIIHHHHHHHHYYHHHHHHHRHHHHRHIHHHHHNHSHHRHCQPHHRHHHRHHRRHPPLMIMAIFGSIGIGHCLPPPPFAIINHHPLPHGKETPNPAQTLSRPGLQVVFTVCLLVFTVCSSVCFRINMR